MYTQVLTEVSTYVLKKVLTYINMYQDVLMLFNWPCPGMWGWEPSLEDLQVGQEGMEKLDGARGCFLSQRIQIQTPEQWIIHISPDQKEVYWCFKGEHCQALTRPFI